MGSTGSPQVAVKTLPFKNLSLIRFEESPKVYYVESNKLRHVPTLEVFNARKFKFQNVKVIKKTSSTLKDFPGNIGTDLPIKDEVTTPTPIPPTTKVKGGRLVKAPGDPKIYYINQLGLKRWIPTEKIFLSYNNSWKNIQTITSTELNSIPDSILIRGQGDTKVYKIENPSTGSGQVTKRWITTSEAFNRLGLNWKDIVTVNKTELEYYGMGEEMR